SNRTPSADDKNCREGVMAYLFAMFAGLIGAAAGWAAGDALEPTIAAYRALLPDVEILHRVASSLNPEVIGASAGLLIPACLTLPFYGGHCPLPALAWRSIAVVTAVVVFSAATLRVGAVVIDQFGMNAGAPTVAFEIRLPAIAAPSK